MFYRNAAQSSGTVLINGLDMLYVWGHTAHRKPRYLFYVICKRDLVPKGRLDADVKGINVI